MERQHIVFIAAAAAAFAALIVFGLFNPFQQIEGDEDVDGDSEVIKVKKGEQALVRYSPAVIKMIQDLPDKNTLELEVSSELQVVNLAGVRGQIRYLDMDITWVEDGQEETIDDGDFNTIAYRFLPDKGNKTRYVYQNADFTARSEDAQVVVAVKPLSSAKVGEQYTVRMLLHTGGIIDYAIDDKIIEIVP